MAAVEAAAAAGATHRPIDASGSVEVVCLLTLSRSLLVRRSLYHIPSSLPVLWTPPPPHPSPAPPPTAHQSNGSILSGMGCAGQLALKGIAHHK